MPGLSRTGVGLLRCGSTFLTGCCSPVPGQIADSTSPLASSPVGMQPGRPLPLPRQLPPWTGWCLSFYSGYRMILHDLLNRIRERFLAPGRKWGGILEKGGKACSIFPVCEVISAEGVETKRRRWPSHGAACSLDPSDMAPAANSWKDAVIVWEWVRPREKKSMV